MDNSYIFNVYIFFSSYTHILIYYVSSILAIFSLFAIAHRICCLIHSRKHTKYFTLCFFCFSCLHSVLSVFNSPDFPFLITCWPDFNKIFKIFFDYLAFDNFFISESCSFPIRYPLVKWHEWYTLGRSCFFRFMATRQKMSRCCLPFLSALAWLPNTAIEPNLSYYLPIVLGKRCIHDFHYSMCM